MHRLLSRSSLFAGLLILTVVVGGCTSLPPVTGGTPATAVLTTEPGGTSTAGAPVSPVPGSVSVVDTAQQALASQLGVKVEDVRVVSSSQVDWPNGCLGVQKPGVMCTQVITPGYQVILEANGKQYEMRTDLTGQQVVLAPEGTSQAAMPEAAVRVRERAAVDLGVETGLVMVVSAEQVDWPDACLGAATADEVCAQVVTPGYRVTMESNGQQYVYRTDQSGQNIRPEAQASPSTPSGQESPAALAARDALAKQLGVAVNSIGIKSVEPTQWSDSCLGAGGPAESCALVVTPGNKVVLEYKGQQYVYHTDLTGQNVRPAPENPTPVPSTPAPSTPTAGSAGQTSAAVIGLRRDVDGTCTDVRVDLQGVQFGACGTDMVASGFITGTNQLEQLMDMQRVYDSFGVSTPSGKVTFVGKGPIQATPIEQRMIAEWANLVALETRQGTRVAQYGMEWHREGGIAGFCDDIKVDPGGHATLTSCKPSAPGTATAPSWRRLTSDELTQFYGWLDQFGAVQAEQKDPATADQMTIRASFAGRGTGQATDADKTVMLQFGAQLLQQWAVATPARWINTLAEVNMRKGPGEQFEVVQKIAAGQQALVTGVSTDNQWWRVVCPDDTVGNCWVSADPTLTQPIAPGGSTGIKPGPEGQPAIDETQILAAVIRRLYTVDDTFGGKSNLSLIYLLSVDDSDGNAIPYSSPARPLPAPVQLGVVSALSDLPAQFNWVGSAGEVKRDNNNVVEGKGAIITVGKVQPQPDGSVQVNCSIYLSPIAAGGQTYVLQNQGGQWKVTGTTGSQWIS